MSNILVSIPKNAENLALPDPDLLIYFQELEERCIWLDDEITPELTLAIAKQILVWNREDKAIRADERKPIKIFFFSPGGDLDTSNALIDAVKLSVTPIWGINMGQCASGAAFTFISCHKRFMTPRSYFLFHQGSGAFSGSFSEVCYQIEEYQNAIERLTSFMVEHTKYKEEEVLENIQGEWYIHAEEAISRGVCDVIIKDFSEIV